MSTADRAADRMDTVRSRRTRARSASVHEESPRSLDDVVRVVRGLRRKLHRELDERPEAVLAAVAATSFVAGAALGSRLGRIVLSALTPLALQHVVTTRIAPRIAAYVAELVDGEENEDNDGSASKPQAS